MTGVGHFVVQLYFVYMHSHQSHDKLSSVLIFGFADTLISIRKERKHNAPIRWRLHSIFNLTRGIMLRRFHLYWSHWLAVVPCSRHRWTKELAISNRNWFYICSDAEVLEKYVHIESTHMVIPPIYFVFKMVHISY